MSGNAATYASVLPGVDLQVEATDQGADVAVVVNSAEAAASVATFSLASRRPG